MMSGIFSHPVMESQDPVLSDARLVGILGIATANARMRMAENLERSFTAGTQYDAAKESVLIVVGKAAEVQPGLTVTQLVNLLTTGRR